MTMPDLNLLVTMNALLSEGSVAGAARKLRLSPSAMSRALARLRYETRDPLLVRAGRGLVPTPRALELRDQVRRVVHEAQAVLRPAFKLDLGTLTREFAIRSSEGFVETFGSAILARVAREAPGVGLRFLPKTDKDSTPLREGSIDLETGVTSKEMGPEIHVRGLFRDRFVGIVREQHPLTIGRLTAARYANAEHVLIARRGLEMAPVDEALGKLGLERRGKVTVGGFSPAIMMARESDLVATVPEKHTLGLCKGLRRLPLPMPVPPFMISLFWHPRLDADPAHRWLRSIIVDACRTDAA